MTIGKFQELANRLMKLDRQIPYYISTNHWGN